MSLFVASLNSGSNGNCYYPGNEREAILVDAGISCRETETCMAWPVYAQGKSCFVLCNPAATIVLYTNNSYT